MPELLKKVQRYASIQISTLLTLMFSLTNTIPTSCAKLLSTSQMISLAQST